ncbi:MAG: hypothetical protein RIQ93_1019 [Verrucomicrobiota bacterium]|jgi:4-diphosphocytidyl-2-C-methyl-D-erythritol kinase
MHKCWRRVTSLSIFAPAKLNLFLAITGRRSDGFHDLVSLAAPLDFGDTLLVEHRAAGFILESNSTEAPVDETNLVLKAARAFAAATGWPGGARFVLEKRIPVGAGLGGGSSDAVATLRGLNRIAGSPLGASALDGLAAQLGSDCPLFLRDAAVVMRGKGEQITLLSAVARARLSGRRVLIFKPGFSVATAWAYGRLASIAPAGYLPARAAEELLATWLQRLETDGFGGTSREMDESLVNTMESAVFAKFIALPAMLDLLRTSHGLRPRMSGSGSACFAFLSDDDPVAAIIATIRAGWGDSAFVMEARLK